MDERFLDDRSPDETLHMIARMTAPEGLEERVKAGLRLAEAPGRVLAWRHFGNGESVGGRKSLMRSGWARGAAAAAIALVVLGGGWGIYARVEPAQSAKTGALPVAQPSGATQTGAFREAGAMRRPLTLTGPNVPQQNGTGPAGLKSTEPKAAQPIVHSKVSNAKPGAPGASRVAAPIQ